MTAVNFVHQSVAKGGQISESRKSAHGRRLVARKKKSDLEKYLVEFYACDRVYTFDSLYEDEFWSKQRRVWKCFV